MPKSNVRIGLIQTSCGPHPQENLENALRQIERTADRGAQIVGLQELFSSRYFCVQEETRHFKWAEPIPGPTTEALCEVAAQKKIVIIGSIFEKRTRGIYHNTAIVIDADGSLIGRYRKMHIPDDPYYYEKFYFTPGDLGFKAFQTRYAKIGLLICWDQWFPEAARLTALQGAQILFYPTAIGWLPNEKPRVKKQQYLAWETIQKSHAIANGIYVAAVNRVGSEGRLKFWGGSFVSNPFGETLGRASKQRPQNLIVSCDLSKIETARQEWPFFRDRRIDAYKPMTQRFLD